VGDNACVACAAGTTNAAGDDASGSSTRCDVIKCLANQHVLSNSCLSCSAGMINEAGDDASSADTQCKPIICVAGQYVNANTCKQCPAGTVNVAGDSASGPNTKCDPPCATDEFQTAALVLNCAGGGGTQQMNLLRHEIKEIAIVPEGVTGLNISLSADGDLDSKLYYPGGICMVGYACQHFRKGSFTDAGMDIYFSGDDIYAPVTETVQITTRITKALDIRVKGYVAAKGTITYAYGVIDPCPTTLPGCSKCSAYNQCGKNMAVCDGTSTVQCT